MALTSFWVAGIVAYAQQGHGFTRLLGLVYFPILLLPFVGKGTLGGLAGPQRYLALVVRAPDDPGRRGDLAEPV